MSAPAAAAATVSAGSKLPFPGAVEDSGRRVQPRHFHFGPNPAASPASDDATAAEADRLPPAARLYRHALESIFAFLNQRELVKALQVSKGWLAAVELMASLELTVEQTSAPLRVMAQSAMGCHVAVLGKWGRHVSVTADSLFIGARHMAQLRELSCELHLTPSEGPLTFPPALQTLSLHVHGTPAAADICAAIRAIGRLSLLESLSVHLQSFDGQLSFGPLASMPLLRHLAIFQMRGGVELSDAQVDQLRALPLLQRLDVQPMPTSLLRRLLEQPHNLQWQEITLPDPLDDEAAALLPQLPSLTALDKSNFAVTCSRFNFLRQMPKLSFVILGLSEPSAPARMESLIGGLQHCSQIEDLALCSTELTAAHLAELLPGLPRLRWLTLASNNITTLSFLSQPTLAQQLTSFQLLDCDSLPLAELRHAHSLQHLTELSLWQSFNAPMDALSQSLFTPPSLLLPQLEEFHYEQPSAE